MGFLTKRERTYVVRKQLCCARERRGLEFKNSKIFAVYKYVSFNRFLF
jgi:hypothetical protein